MVSKNKILEIVSYYLSHSKAEVLEAYSLSEETFNRYLRNYKKDFGESVDILAQLKERFTDQELKELVKGSRKENTIGKASYSFSGEEVTFLAITDTHFGSSYTNEKRLDAIFNEAEKRGCQFMCHVGDVTEGMPNRPNAIYEMSQIGYKAQRDIAVKALKQWTKKSYYIAGNHDEFYNDKIGAGLDIVEDICKELPDAKYLGLESGLITLEPSGVTIRLWHGKDSGSSYALSYRPQRIINALTPQQKSSVLLLGHDHKQNYIHYRNIHTVSCGCIQSQSAWMASKGLQAMEGFHIIKMGVKDKEVKWFEPRFYPFYV